MRTREICFFNNYDVDNYYEAAKENLIINEVENFTDNDVWEESYFLQDLDFEESCREINELLNPQVLVTGQVGRWDGTYDGGKVYSNETFEKIIGDLGEDCDYFKITLKSGKIEIQCSHHDGTNYYTLQNLSEKGYNLFNDWDYGQKLTNYSEREIHQKLAKSRVYCEKIKMNW